MNKAILLVLILLSQQLLADGNLTVYFFYSTTCPHCHEESLFLEKLQANTSFEIRNFSVDNSQENRSLLGRFAKAYSVTPNQVPQLYIGNKVLIGYGSYETHGKLIEGMIDECLGGCVDSYQIVLKNESNQPVNTTLVESSLVSYPFIGVVDLNSPLSLVAVGIFVLILAGIVYIIRKHRSK